MYIQACYDNALFLRRQELAAYPATLLSQSAADYLLPAAAYILIVFHTEAFATGIPHKRQSENKKVPPCLVNKNEMSMPFLPPSLFCFSAVEHPLHLPAPRFQ